MKIIIFDFEVFKFDTLLGCYVISDSENPKYYQTWDLDKIRQYYTINEDSIWIGHNNYSYDNNILDAILKKQDAYERSKSIIELGKRSYSNVPKYTYDLMANSYKPFSLKLTEFLQGSNIHTSDVNFDLNRPLTDEEKELTESYNRDDLLQTYKNFEKMYDLFKLRLDIINEFNLDLSMLRVTGTKLASTVLHAVHNDRLKYDIVKPIIYPNLQLKNKDLWDYYLNEKFRTDEKIEIQVGNAILKVGAGGIHSAEKKFHAEKCMYFDVSGYYNLIMINCGLLPRTMNQESRDLYIYMYKEQLRLKKINPVKRGLYKTILLSVFGATMNEYTDFYDPWHGGLITITGQLFLVDLLEKLENLCTIVQTNTDGLAVVPFDWNDEKKIIGIVEEWEQRTGFVIKKEYIYDLYQRDVNCYIAKDMDGKIIYKGEAVKNFDLSKQSFANGNLFDCKEPPIIAQGIVNALINGILPEQFVDENKDNMILFQYPCKRGTFKKLIYDVDGTIIEIQSPSRVFANKLTNVGMVYKTKETNGKFLKTKVANLPSNVFLYNDEILSDEAIKKIQKNIDYQYYVNRIYERIGEFINI